MPEAACQTNPRFGKVFGLPTASTPLTCVTQLGLFFVFAFTFVRWIRFEGRFFCTVFLGLVPMELLRLGLLLALR